jgi:DNA-binding transcriptional ArsR family regulator
MPTERFTRKSSGAPSRPTRDRDRDYSNEAVRIARNLTRHDPYLRLFADDFANKALLELKKAMATEDIKNPAAFMQWKIKKLMFSAIRKRKAEVSRLNMWQEEMQAVRGKRIDDHVDTRRHFFSKRGLTLDIISKEEQQMANLKAAAIVAIMPDPADREILADRFYQPDMSISDIARKHGGRSPSSLANHLKKILGTDRTPGAIAPVNKMMDGLSLATATAYLREISRLEEASVVTDPFAGAISYLELASTYSSAHKRSATVGIARLRWLQANMPSQRGLQNKILARLVRAACLYVIEPNDARHDERSDIGLHDDVKVLEEVHRVVAKYANK